MKKRKNLIRFVSFVSAVVMIALFSVNAFAASSTVTYKSYYSFTSMMQNQAGNYNVEFTVYMKPTVNLTSSTNGEIKRVSAYVTIEWNKTEALPDPPKNACLILYIQQYYQPKDHYSLQSVQKKLGSINIASLFDASVETSTGYKYTSPSFFGTAITASEMTEYGSGYNVPYGFLYWQNFEVNAIYVPDTEIPEFPYSIPDAGVSENYNTIIYDCAHQN